MKLAIPDMNPTQLLKHFDCISEVPDAVPRLRQFILELAVRGKLVEQDPNDEPAAELIKRIRAEKARLVKHGKIKESKPLAITDSDNGLYKIPKNWKWVQLGESVNSHFGGGTPSKNNSTYWDGDIFWASVKDVGKGKYIDDTIDRISQAGLTDSSSNLIPPGNLIVVTRMGLGKISINRVPIAINQDLRALSLSSLAAIDYYYIFFKTHRFEGTGLTVKGIKVEELMNIAFPLPPLAEQHRIVAKVDELMALCDQLEAAKTQREQSRDLLVAASLQRLNDLGQNRHSGRDRRNPDSMDGSNPEHPCSLDSGDPCRNDDKYFNSIALASDTALPGDWIPVIPAGMTDGESIAFFLNHLPRITTRPTHIKQLRQAILNLAIRGHLVPQDQNDAEARVALTEAFEVKRNLVRCASLPKRALPDAAYLPISPFALPTNWVFVNFDHLSAPVLNALKAGPFGSAIKKDSYVSQGYKVYGQEQVIGQNAEIGDYYISETKFNQLKSCAIAPGDLLISLVGTIGKVLVLPSGCQEGIINPRLIKLSLDSKLVNPNYVQLLLGSPWVKEFLFAEARGTTMDVLNLSILRSLPVPLPPLAEQHRIVAKVDELMALCDQLEAQLTTTEADSRRLLEAVLHETLSPPLAEAA